MIAQFLRETATASFVWGQNDCALWCASAVQFMTGTDPAADLRCTYSSWVECRGVIMRAGGLEALIAPRMERLSLPPIDREGVAIVQFGKQKLCGIVTGDFVSIRTLEGVQATRDFQIIRGWSWSQR